MATPTLQEMIKAVRVHAEERQHNGWGWDIVVEAMTDDEIAEVIAKCKTNHGAISKIGSAVWACKKIEKEIAATAF